MFIRPRGAERCVDYAFIDSRIAYFDGRMKRWRDLIDKVSDSISSMQQMYECVMDAAVG